MINRKQIAVSHPVLAGREREYVLECLDTGWISSIGRFIGQFEMGFASYCEAGFGVATNNGTTALHLALSAFGLTYGDEVIVPSLTYIASANAVRYCGATPVFVDSEPGTMNIDPSLIEDRITERTRGIIVVHLYGHPANMDPILEIARRRGLFVLEDAAESHGARYKGKRTGSLGDAATFSFYGNKVITSGEGGMITTSNEILRNKLRLLRGQGMDPDRRYWFPVIGFNYRMTNVTAAIGLAQLEQIDGFLRARREIASQYSEGLDSLSEFLKLPTVESWADHSFWSYVIVLRRDCPIGRDELMRMLQSDGIETRPVFYPMHVLPPYAEPQGHYPVADELGAGGICLPMHGLLTKEDISFIVARIRFRLAQPSGD